MRKCAAVKSGGIARTTARRIGRCAPAVALVLCGAVVCGAQAKRSRPAPAPAVQPTAMFLKFPDWVPCLAFSPDGGTLAAGSYGVVKLFDLAEHREAAALQEPAGFVKSVAFSPDGGTLAAGSYQTAALWNTSDRTLRLRLKGHRGYVTALAYSPDGGTLATASEDETVRLWDPASGESRGVIDRLEQPALGVAFSPDGHTLAVATGDVTRPAKKGGVRIYSLAGDLRHAVAGHERVVAAVAFAPDGGSLASASADETIRLWNPVSGEELRTLEGHSRPVNSLAFLPGGAWLASASGGRNNGGNEIKLWEVAAGKDRLTIPAHEAPVLAIALSADGQRLASGSVDKSVKLWDVAALLAAAQGTDPTASPAAGPNTASPAQTGAAGAEAAAEQKPKVLRAGIIGLDTSHAIAFSQILNAADAPEDVSNCRVVAAYPQGSPDIESSTSRVPGYIKEVEKLGVEIVESIDELLGKVDVVLLETNDGRPHLEQVLPVLKAGKPVFIDKPVAGTLADAVAIFEAGKTHGVPLFSASSLRYAPGAQAIRGGKIGEVKGADTYSPAHLEPTHPDLFWYGIHGVETLFTVMGAGCESVTRTSTPGIDLVVGVWSGGRVGTFRGVREESGGGKVSYGGTAFGTGGIMPIGDYGGYRPLVVEIVKFFRTGTVPVSAEETLEIYAFMEAADESKRRGGEPVKISEVLVRARVEAKEKLGK